MGGLVSSHWLSKQPPREDVFLSARLMADLPVPRVSGGWLWRPNRPDCALNKTHLSISYRRNIGGSVVPVFVDPCIVSVVGVDAIWRATEAQASRVGRDQQRDVGREGPRLATRRVLSGHRPGPFLSQWHHRYGRGPDRRRQGGVSPVQSLRRVPQFCAGDQTGVRYLGRHHRRRAPHNIWPQVARPTPPGAKPTSQSIGIDNPLAVWYALRWAK